MVDLKQATEIVKFHFPDGDIKAVVEHKGKFVFQVFNNLPFEENLDPYFTVDKVTGEFLDFSWLMEADIALSNLFEKALRKV